jgi:heme-degrading monooxygenase HmoA
MIARRWRVWTDEDGADGLTEYLRGTGVGAALNTLGCLGALLLRSDVTNAEVEFTLFTFWDSIDAVQAFAGSDYLRAMTYPADRGHFTRFDEIVEHLDVAAHDRLFP